MTPCKHCGAVPRDDGYGYWSVEHKDVCPLYDEESAQIIAPNERCPHCDNPIEDGEEHCSLCRRVL